MEGEGKVIFNRRSIYLSLFIVAGMAAISVLLAVQDRNPWIGLQVGGIGIGIALMAAYIGSRLAGMRQLSKIVLQDDTLIVQRVHFLDRGEILRLPLAEIEDWSAQTRRFKGEAYSDISFTHRGRKFSFYLSDDAKPDMAAIESLMPASAWTDAQAGR